MQKRRGMGTRREASRIWEQVCFKAHGRELRKELTRVAILARFAHSIPTHEARPVTIIQFNTSGLCCAMPPPPPGSSSHQSRRNPSTTPSPTDAHEISSSRVSKDSEGYPSWLPKRPPPPAPASTFASSVLGGPSEAPSPSPVEPPPMVGGRKPTPRSVRIVNLQDSYGRLTEKQTRSDRDAVEQARGGPHAPPRVWTRASGVPPTAFNASEHDEFLPLPQPRFKAKNLQLERVESHSKWMRLYFYLWPLLVFYHIPLQTYFDFNAAFILLQVAKYPNPLSSGKNWALGGAAYIASWLAWIFVVCVVYELVYSFTRRWRLRRPLMLPIYLSSAAFNYAAMTSFTNFSFLQHLRFSAFFPEQTDESDVDHDLHDYYGDAQGSWKQGLAETFSFYSQNVSTVALLLPRAGLCLALLFSFSSPASTFGTSSNFMNRDATWFRLDGSLTDYARGVLIANAAWTGWRALVLLVSWLGLWAFSNQRLGGLCGPRDSWEESEQEKTRSIYSEAASEYGAYRGSFYQGGEANAEYGGDELAWPWREVTRARIQDVFECCVSARNRSSGSGNVLRWSTTPGAPAPGYGYALRSKRQRRSRHRSMARGKELPNEKMALDGSAVNGVAEPEGLERVLAAVGLPTASSPSRRGVLTQDLFAAPASTSHHPVIEPIAFHQTQPIASSSMLTGLEVPKAAKRSSKDKIPGSAPLQTLPYPFSKPGSGHVSSKDSVPFPATGSEAEKKSKSSRKGKSSKSGTSSASESAETSGTGSGSTGDEDDEEEEGEDEDEDEDDQDDDENEDDVEDSEAPSTGCVSGSMSSLGQPISPSRRLPLVARRPAAGAHARSPSGVSSGMSAGSHAHSHSMSSSYGTGAVSVLTHSTGNRESTDSEAGRERASLSQGSSHHGHSFAISPLIPMPPRHPHQTRNRSSLATPSAAMTLSNAALQAPAIVFPSVQSRTRVDSGRGILVNPALLYGESMDSDLEGDLELDEDEDQAEENSEHTGEEQDQVGLLGLPRSPRSSLGGSLAESSSGQGDARTRTHSAYSSRSRHSSRARSRPRTHSSHSLSVRERANSLGTSMRSLMQGATASLTQLDLVMRGATGPAAGLGLGLGGVRTRSRANSSMARLEEDPVLPPHAMAMSERPRGASGGSSGSGSAFNDDVILPNPLLDRTRRELEAEGYSSGGSHSRSGSESYSQSGENYTFGRPMLFMRPAQQSLEEHAARVQAGEVTAEGLSHRRSSSSFRRSSPIPIVRRVDALEPDTPLQSARSESFYSVQSERTAGPHTPVVGRAPRTL
ncbi:hypothetical protein D9619_008810 [Psilocybe cf. subviscida]|uniref:Proteophosphoglycan ppg4 n=1 Tax=Psilocybe cf. subviscida TaxID=2480587 RepID=A0A8H5BAG4_9AGAR|nr:hypothetical protein D9619_008810 [Psilocybe cf. subviscida]